MRHVTLESSDLKVHWCKVCAQDGWKMDPNVKVVLVTSGRGLWMLVFASEMQGCSLDHVED